MSYEELRRIGAIEKVAVTPREVAGLLALARRDLRTAQGVAAIDLDWALNIAYNAILQSSTAYLASQGYRVTADKGHHYYTFRFMEEALPDDKAMIRRLQKLRKKRNMSVYEQAGVIGEKEIHEVIEFADRYYHEIVRLLPPEVTRDPDEEEPS